MATELSATKTRERNLTTLRIQSSDNVTPSHPLSLSLSRKILDTNFTWYKCEQFLEMVEILGIVDNSRKFRKIVGIMDNSRKFRKIFGIMGNSRKFRKILGILGTNVNNF